MKLAKRIMNCILIIMVIFLGYSYFTKKGLFSKLSFPNFQKHTHTQKDDVNNVNDNHDVKIGGYFELINQDGKLVKSSDFKNQYMVVLFGFSTCQSICPIELSIVSKALEKLGNQSTKVQPIFITVDPQRDTVAKLKEYHNHFDNRIQMLTGSKQDLEQVVNKYKVYVGNQNENSDPHAQIDHSSIIYIMHNDKYITHFVPDFNASDLQVDKLVEIIKGLPAIK